MGYAEGGSCRPYAWQFEIARGRTPVRYEAADCQSTVQPPHCMPSDVFGRFHDLRIMRRAETDVMREHGRAVDVVLAVDCVNAVSDRNL